MRKHLVVLVMLSLVAALGAAYMTQGWMADQGRPQAAETPAVAEPEPPETRVLVANAELAAGTILQAGHLRWQSWPEDGMSDSYLVKTDGEEDHDLVGAVARQSLSQGEPITERRVVRPGDQGFLAAMLAPDKRAISVPVSASSGLSGLVFPGDRVDVLVTHSVGDRQSNTGHARRASETVVKDVRVLALDQRTDDGEGQRVVAKTATLEVTPKQAEKVSLAQQLGSLSLSLRPVARNGMDEAPRALAFTVDSEISAVVGFPPSDDDDRGPKVRVVRGDSAEDVTFGGASR